MSLLKTLGVALLVMVSVSAAAVFWFVNVHGISARQKPVAIEEFVARRLRNRAIPRGAAEMNNSGDGDTTRDR